MDANCKTDNSKLSFYPFKSFRWNNLLRKNILLLRVLWILWIFIFPSSQQKLNQNDRPRLIDNFSFNFQTNLMPKEYDTFGAGVILKNKAKLIPFTSNKIGALFLHNKFRSNSFTLDYVFKINSSTEKSDGFIMWYLHQLPNFDVNSGRIHGVNQDTNGLSIRLYKTENNKWRIFAHYDRGEGNNLENAIIRPDNSWTFMLDPTKVNTKIRIEKVGGKLSVFVTDDSAQSENWRNWVVFHNELLNYQGFIGFTAGNTNNIVNDIDILSVMLYDIDQSSIYASNKIDESDNTKYIDLNDKVDISSFSKKFFHNQNILNLTNIHDTIEFKIVDNKEQVLTKVWEALRIYNINMANLIKTMRRFDKDRSDLIKQSTEDKRLLSIFQNIQVAKTTIDLIGNSLVSVNDTVTFLSSEVKDVKSDLSREEQDTTQRLISMISNLNYKIDNLQAKMQSHESHSQTYISQLNDKANQLKKDMGNIMIDTLNKQSDQIGQKVSNDGSYWTYIFVIVLVVGLTLLMRRKIQNETKKHIL